MESGAQMYIDLLQNSRTDVDKAVRSSCFYHENVPRAGLSDYIADHEARLAFLQEHDLVVFVNMQRRTTPRRRLDEVHRDCDISLFCPDEVVGDADQREILFANHMHGFFHLSLAPQNRLYRWVFLAHRFRPE